MGNERVVETDRLTYRFYEYKKDNKIYTEIFLNRKYNYSDTKKFIIYEPLEKIKEFVHNDNLYINYGDDVKQLSTIIAENTDSTTLELYDTLSIVLTNIYNERYYNGQTPTGFTDNIYKVNCSLLISSEDGNHLFNNEMAIIKDNTIVRFNYFNEIHIEMKNKYRFKFIDNEDKERVEIQIN